MFSFPARMRSVSLMAALPLFAVSGVLPAHAVQGAGSAKTGPAPQGVVTPAHLSYAFDSGKVYHYKVLAFFSGQIPKLSEPGTDAHIKAELYYAAKLVKQDASGMTLQFTVEAETLSFLAKEPGEDGKVNPDDELPFPLPIAQVQSFLNCTAVIKPDGTIASVTGGSTQPIKIDVGVDLRKLFILMMPVTFPQSGATAGGTWSFNEGFLGKKPGRTTYTGKLDSARNDAGTAAFQISQVAKSSILDKIDKEGNSTPDPQKQVGTITGDVSASGTMMFSAFGGHGAATAVKPGFYAGMLKNGKMLLNVNLKRDMPDTEHPDKRLVDPITVRGRLTVSLQAGPPAEASAK
jgi:hypothetical protein